MKTRILPEHVYVLTEQEERDYDLGGYSRDTVEDSLSQRFGESTRIANDEFVEVRRPDGRVIGRYRVKD